VTTVLVVAAVDAELGDLPGATLGVGPLRAAVAMTRLLIERSPDAVLLVGSCGVYGDRFTPGTAVVGTSLGFADTGAALGKGYVPLAPEPLNAHVEGVPVGVPLASVLTLVAITSDAQAAAAHGQHWDVEHMETYGAALACSEAGVPFSVVLGVANRVGPDAHAEWLANRDRAERSARQVARRWLASRGQFASHFGEPTG